MSVNDIAKRLGVRPQMIRRAVRRLRGRTNNVGKGGRYSWPSFEHSEVKAIEEAVQNTSDHFAEESAEFQQLTLRVPKDLHVALRTIALAQGQSINDIGIRALIEYMSQAGRREEVGAYIRQTQEQFRVTLDKLKDL